MKEKKTSATLVFHGPLIDRSAGRKAVSVIIKKLGGRYSTCSFFHKKRGWFSKDTKGLVAHDVTVPIRHYREAVQMAREITKNENSNVWLSHHWSNFWALSPKKRKGS